ncbi:FGGY-family carbohydrate kinase [Paenibacillus donghaensis]|uniref:FGGY-family carbohydrate kinase n=1 Tax=Paenibacillus donghaensis TaxID=414771 RepID=UPI001D16CD01|nr:FGGY-family carbohydrate kinase [Paenibacillus donghaensis]
MAFLIGIDAGTTNVKAVLFDLKGNEKKVVYRKNEPIYFSTSHVEQDMNVLWEKVLECLTELVQNYDKDEILGISLSGQGEGCWLVDENGEPVSHSYLWNDGRAKDLVNEIFADEEMYRSIFETTGTQPLTGTALVLLLWSKKYRKKELDRADKILFAKDWIRYKLTGKFSLDTTDAGTSLLNIKTLQPAYELLDKLGLGEYKHLISDINKPSDIAGSLTKEISEITGLNTTTPVAYGAVDVSLSTMGVGAVNSGEICTILGTTCATNIVTHEITPGKENTRFEKHCVDDLYINIQPTMSGATNIDWVVENISSTKSFDEMDEEISQLKPVPTGVIYHPYLNTAGERSPFFNTDARSSFFGINSHTKRKDLIKSVYEGIAFSIRDCLEATGQTNGGTIYLAGGGARSKAWSQIIADVTNKEVKVSEGKEFAAKGAVMMLAVTLGIYKNYNEAAAAMCRAKATYKPIKENANVYNYFSQFYKELRLSYDALWNKRYRILKEIGEEMY